MARFEDFILLIELVAVIIAASAFLFYWNRLVGSVFAFLLRLITWRRYNAYISIKSLQISPLAGRISFRDLEYHSSNLSIRALNGHITWRYWKLRVRQEEDSKSTNPKRSEQVVSRTCAELTNQTDYRAGSLWSLKGWKRSSSIGPQRTMRLSNGCRSTRRNMRTAKSRPSSRLAHQRRRVRKALGSEGEQRKGQVKEDWTHRRLSRGTMVIETVGCSDSC